VEEIKTAMIAQRRRNIGALSSGSVLVSKAAGMAGSIAIPPPASWISCSLKPKTSLRGVFFAIGRRKGEIRPHQTTERQPGLVYGSGWGTITALWRR
jgi:hypothetical protein